jgi:hypothetical protein
MMPRRLGVVFAVLALVALTVTPAFAATINQDQVPTTAAEWTAANPDKSAEECSDPANVPPEGMARWHFILNGATTGQTVTLTAQFEDGDGNPVTLTDVGDEADASGTYHFDIDTPDDYTLINATTNEVGPSLNLNLSHVCLGGPPVIIPEAPASILLVLTAALVGVWFLRRQSTLGKTIA